MPPLIKSKMWPPGHSPLFPLLGLSNYNSDIGKNVTSLKIIKH